MPFWARKGVDDITLYCMYNNSDPTLSYFAELPELVLGLLCVVSGCIAASEWYRHVPRFPAL